MPGDVGVAGQIILSRERSVEVKIGDEAKGRRATRSDVPMPEKDDGMHKSGNGSMEANHHSKFVSLSHGMYVKGSRLASL